MRDPLFPPLQNGNVAQALSGRNMSAASTRYVVCVRMPALLVRAALSMPFAHVCMKAYLFLSRLPRSRYLGAAMLLYALLLWLGGNQFAVDELPGRGQLSKVYHVIFYAWLGLALWFSARQPGVFKVTLWVMLAGCGDEINQSFHPFRTAAFSDVVLDTLAGLSSVLVLHCLRQNVVAGKPS